MNQERVLIPCGDIQLRGTIHKPSDATRLPGAVVCHPHPLMGGSMDVSVVTAVCEELVGAGIMALRFNFRGVGGSGGSYSRGVGEREDVAAALTHLSSCKETRGQAIGLVGYSFGAYVAAWAADEGVSALVLISPPLPNYDFSSLAKWDKPLLVITGDEDAYCPPDLALELTKKAEVSGQVVVEVVAGADHFWWGQEEEVAARVAHFMSGVLCSAAEG